MHKQQREEIDSPNELDMGFIAHDSNQGVLDQSSHNSEDPSISTIPKSQATPRSQLSFDVNNELSSMEQWAFQSNNIAKPKRRAQVIYQENQQSGEEMTDKMKKGMTKKIVNGKIKIQQLSSNSPYQLRSKRKIGEQNSSNSDNEIRQMVEQINQGNCYNFNQK